jgi:hypothetical protein
MRNNPPTAFPPSAASATLCCADLQAAWLQRQYQSTFHAMKPDGLGRSRALLSNPFPPDSSHARTDALMHCMRWHIWTFDPMLDPYLHSNIATSAETSMPASRPSTTNQNTSSTGNDNKYTYTLTNINRAYTGRRPAQCPCGQPLASTNVSL